ncbi:MAG: hypothetical protein Q6359_09680, partial [Candidatus Brocadiales bacterium]|nr:hypothetical protein [Candidatus Brocadiales bacterium]
SPHRTPLAAVAPPSGTETVRLSRSRPKPDATITDWILRFAQNDIMSLQDFCRDVGLCTKGQWPCMTRW